MVVPVSVPVLVVAVISMVPMVMMVQQNPAQVATIYGSPLPRMTAVLLEVLLEVGRGIAQNSQLLDLLVVQKHLVRQLSPQLAA